jgi:hypothetical protein
MLTRHWHNATGVISISHMGLSSGTPVGCDGKIWMQFDTATFCTQSLEQSRGQHFAIVQCVRRGIDCYFIRANAEPMPRGSVGLDEAKTNLSGYLFCSRQIATGRHFNVPLGLATRAYTKLESVEYSRRVK